MTERTAVLTGVRYKDCLVLGCETV